VGNFELNKVYNEDCLETLKRLPNNSIDLVIADPPYEIVSGGSGGCFGVEQRDYHKGVKSLSDGFENIILDECKRVLKIFNCYFFCSKDQVLQILLWAKENNMNTDILCYHKLNPIPTTNNKYLSDTEYIIFMRGAGAYLGGDYGSKKKYFLQNNSKSEFDHPTVKPLNIIRTLIGNSSREGDVIYDPFMGSGTTAIASIIEKRNYIGSEISVEYFKVLTKRINNETAQTKLF
jgi:site-specific DNA-methyltransferase (adenine-specific)